MITEQHILQSSRIFLRIALGATFLVACADRFGILGQYGSRNVSWGDWKHFEQYAGVLVWFLPKAAIPTLAIVETVIEVALGMALLAGTWTRLIAWASAGLLASFAATMSIALGIIAPISYGVFTAIGAALLLGAVAPRAAIRRRSELPSVGSNLSA
ncbi:MAG TPA: MauE/DoxX family redox-associated membrane protein [Terracidiphilus sp.]|nr:MauE/DoxX family redox-associated membrane protein [Terracidiphilus sp.]